MTYANANDVTNLSRRRRRCRPQNRPQSRPQVPRQRTKRRAGRHEGALGRSPTSPRRPPARRTSTNLIASTSTASKATAEFIHARYYGSFVRQVWKPCSRSNRNKSSARQSSISSQRISTPPTSHRHYNSP